MHHSQDNSCGTVGINILHCQGRSDEKFSLSEPKDMESKAVTSSSSHDESKCGLLTISSIFLSVKSIFLSVAIGGI